SSGHSTGEVFKNIMESDGWKGLFRGNFVNVIRVAPSKAIECCQLWIVESSGLMKFCSTIVL
ncbi:adenine nucleotide transporter BT1 chloroplastic/mitochondrial-like, partial [Trifolium medium]|nr:adenine nucleotide transporter BT1 chloroplastic/mitochondrial-like [Trifolium medium]